MKRFKFNLESVLAIRNKTLNDARIELASIANVLNRQQENLVQLNLSIETLEKESEQYLLKNVFDFQIISNYSSYINKLSQDIQKLKNDIEKTKVIFSKQQQIVKQAYIKVKSLEKLKEKRKEEYNKEVLQEEFKLIDDIVNSRRTIA